MTDPAMTNPIAAAPRDATSAGAAPSPTRTGAPARHVTGPMPGASRELIVKRRLPDGRIREGPLAAERHRAIHLGLLHGDSDGYVEIAAGRRSVGGKLRITTRKDPEHFMPRGAKGGGVDWLESMLALVASHAAADEEVFVGPAVRADRGAAKAHVTHTNWLWIDVDGEDGLPAVKQLLRRRPAHLVIESAGSGGVHCYWRLLTALPAHTQTAADAIEGAHERLIYALGYEWRNGRPTPTVADGACKDRSRVMRLAGTVNGKTGRYARVMWADLALPAWTLRELVGDLPSVPRPRHARRRSTYAVSHDDPYKRIAPADYFQRLAGIEVPQHGLVSCPNPAHRDRTPSCHVGKDASEGWCCHGCGSSGAIYDLASVLIGGPTGRWLRGEDFLRARAEVRALFGEL